MLIITKIVKIYYTCKFEFRIKCNIVDGISSVSNVPVMPMMWHSNVIEVAIFYSAFFICSFSNSLQSYFENPL